MICLGAVIRGETDHYDYVCGEAARGIHGRPARHGRALRLRPVDLSTPMEQALARSGDGKRDTGAHAAQAVLAQLQVRDALKS